MKNKEIRGILCKALSSGKVSLSKVIATGFQGAEKLRTIDYGGSEPGEDDYKNIMKSLNRFVLA